LAIEKDCSEVFSALDKKEVTNKSKKVSVLMIKPVESMKYGERITTERTLRQYKYNKQYLKQVYLHKI
jgi:hypothetical protein